ncbi:MAG: hypothetical protein ABEI52_08600 [Halobacteriaceae archaeon]
MSALETAMTYVGGAISLGGQGVAAAFIGYRTAGPVTSLLFGPLSFGIRVVGVIIEIATMLAGVVLAVRLGDEERAAAALERDET